MFYVLNRPKTVINKKKRILIIYVTITIFLEYFSILTMYTKYTTVTIFVNFALYSYLHYPPPFFATILYTIHIQQPINHIFLLC